MPEARPGTPDETTPAGAALIVTRTPEGRSYVAYPDVALPLIEADKE